METYKTININQFDFFPASRYMGSKSRIIGDIWDEIANFDFHSFYDAFGGSNVVGYYMKCKGKKVITNDFLTISHVFAKATIENSTKKLSSKELDFLLHNENSYSFIQDTFNGIYFNEHENAFLDQVRDNIDKLENPYSRYIGLAALTRACMKKQPRGIFTFVGERYNDGRADMKKSIKEHFIENVSLFNNAVFDNGEESKAYNERTEDLNISADIIYIDPPYYTPNSDNDYTRRYHFVEGLVRKWEGVTIQEHTKTKKFKSFETPFSKRNTAYIAFEHLIKKFKKSVIVISYSSNSFPNKEEMREILEKYKTKVRLKEIDLTYSFGNHNHRIGNNANKVKEYLFVAT